MLHELIRQIQFGHSKLARRHVYVHGINKKLSQKGTGSAKIGCETKVVLGVRSDFKWIVQEISSTPIFYT